MKFGIIFGGQSYEHEISIVSAISLKKVIKNECAYVFGGSYLSFLVSQLLFDRTEKYDCKLF